MTFDIPLQIRPSDQLYNAAEVHKPDLQQLHRGTTIADVRKSGQSADTAHPQPMTITGVDTPPAGTAASDTEPTRRDKAQQRVLPALPQESLREDAPHANGDKQPEDSRSTQATATADEIAQRREQARNAYVDAKTPTERDAALAQYRALVGSADNNFSNVQRSATAYAEELSPGATAAARDFTAADDAMLAVLAKLGSDSTIPDSNHRQIHQQLFAWIDGDAATRARIETDLRTSSLAGPSGLVPLADSLTHLGEVQRAHAEVFRRGEGTEEAVNQRFQAGFAAAMRERMATREELSFALLGAGRTAESEQVRRELESLRH